MSDNALNNLFRISPNKLKCVVKKQLGLQYFWGFIQKFTSSSLFIWQAKKEWKECSIRRKNRQTLKKLNQRIEKQHFKEEQINQWRPFYSKSIRNEQWIVLNRENKKRWELRPWRISLLKWFRLALQKECFEHPAASNRSEPQAVCERKHIEICPLKKKENLKQNNRKLLKIVNF